MADSRTSEVVSRKTSSSTSRHEQLVQQSSQEQQSSTVVISTSNIQLKQKQKQESFSTSQTSQSQKMQSSQQIQQQSQQMQQAQNQKSTSFIQQQQQSIIQQQQQQQQQQKQNNHQLENQITRKNEAELQQLTTSTTGEDELKVTNDGAPTNNEENLYFSNMIKKEQLLKSSESYCLSDDVFDSSNSLVGNVINNNNNNSNNNSPLIIHPDLISGLGSLSSQPPSLVLSVDVDSNSQSHEISSNSSNKSSVEDSFIGQDDIHDHEHDGGGDDEEEEDDDDEDENGSLTNNKERKKKKKVKKTESFSVIEVLDGKLRSLASVYEVYEEQNGNPKPCELRPSEKRVFEKVSVANLRRSFCDLTTSQPNHHHEDEFNFHLIERPKSFTNLDYTIDFRSIKSSFSKFEGGAANSRQSEERDTGANNINNKNELQNTNGLAMECAMCNKRVYAMEKIEAANRKFHKSCFRCSSCNCILGVDTYESNAGVLYCKPHFRELFQPKAVFESQEEAILKRLKKRPELIIRENQPVELPPDVVRATIQPSTAELEDLSVDVKSKFELFEHFKESEANKEKTREPIVVKRSTSVLAKLAKYEGSMEGQLGVSDSDLNGGVPAVVSDDEDDVSTPKYLEEINYNLDDVKNKWESGMNSKKEEIHKHRQEEMAKFRTRLCLGKNSQLKEMYEKAVESTSPTAEPPAKTVHDLDELDLKGKRDIKAMFEKGIVNGAQEEEVNGRESAVDRDREVFESGVARNSRNLFQNLDKQLASGGPNTPTSNPKKISFKNPNGIIGVNDDHVGEGGDIVKSSDVIQDQFRSEDVGSKFRFFETFKENQQAERKVFRITPPRDGQVKMDSPEREIYRDPNVVRSTDDPETKLPVARTASKMLSVFKKLEETAGNDETDQKVVRRPLKQFTPPRETRLERKDSSEEEEESSEYESDEEEDNENGGDINNEEDQFLKEVGSLARAKSLRAKFEAWEIEENSRNQRDSRLQEDLNGGSSIADVCKNIRAKFEQPQQFETQKLPRREVQVKRFVELQNSNGLAMEECVMCNKKVYAMEKIEAGSKIYHKTCFRCSQCKCILRMDTFTQNKGVLFCTPHFKQLFKIKGNYDEGFGHETGKQIWMKKQQQKATESSGSDTKEN